MKYTKKNTVDNNKINFEREMKILCYFTKTLHLYITVLYLFTVLLY